MKFKGRFSKLNESASLIQSLARGKISLKRVADLRAEKEEREREGYVQVCVCVRERESARARVCVCGFRPSSLGLPCSGTREVSSDRGVCVRESCECEALHPNEGNVHTGMGF